LEDEAHEELQKPIDTVGEAAVAASEDATTEEDYQRDVVEDVDTTTERDNDKTARSSPSPTVVVSNTTRHSNSLTTSSPYSINPIEIG